MKIPGDFPDGTSNTFLVVEAGEPVPWTKPEDLDQERGLRGFSRRVVWHGKKAERLETRLAIDGIDRLKIRGD